MAEKKSSAKRTPDTKVETSYDASALEALSPAEQVRRRPGMWIGSTGQKGLHHMVYEIVDNAVDEFMAGYGDLIVVEVAEDGWVTVTDHGRGIPVDTHKETGLSGVELVLTRIGGGGKYGQEGSGYKVSGGLHGVGSSVVNFLSSEMKALVKRDGHEWSMSFKRGEPQGKLKRGRKTTQTGTTISFRYDDEIFDRGVHYDREILQRRLRELAYLNPGLTIELRFHGHKPERFHAEGGIADYMKALVADRDGVEAVHKQPLYFSGSVTEEVEGPSGKKREDTTFIDVALLWTTAQNESWHAFTNAIPNPDGGTHYDGLRKALRKALNEAAEELGKFRAKDEPFEQVDTREGLFNAIHVKVPDPQFEGQTKGKLNNPEVEKRVADFVYRELKAWLTAKENRSQADRVIQRVIEARDGRLAARKARKAVTERKGLLGGSGLPGKLADCRRRDAEDTEIFIVEGDSAGGGMKKARDPMTQAILPLRGKIQNAEKAGEKTLTSEAVKDILSAIGGVITDVKVPVQKNGRTVMRTKLVVDVSEPRYGRVVLCSVDHAEMTFVRDAEGQIRCVRIGEFIDRLLERGEDPRSYEVLCFDQRTGRTRFKALKNVIRHPIDEPLFEARTAYGRKVRVTASHSVFVAEDGEIKLKRGDELKEGDLLVAPRQLPCLTGNGIPERLDLVRVLHRHKDLAQKIILKGPAIAEVRRRRVFAQVADGAELSPWRKGHFQERVSLPEPVRAEMRAARQQARLTLRDMTAVCGVREPASISEWETGRSKPSVSAVKAYCEHLGLDAQAVLERSRVLPSNFETLLESGNGSRNYERVRTVMRLSELSADEVEELGDEVVLSSEKHRQKTAIGRYLPLNEDLFFLAGLYMAEGSFTERGGLRFSLGPGDEHLVDEVEAAARRLFGVETRRYPSYSDSRGYEIRIGSSVAAAVFKAVLGFEGATAHTKRIPDLVFNAPTELQLEFLRGYYLGDGSYNPRTGTISFNTVSAELGSQLQYILAAHGIIAGRKTVEPSPSAKGGPREQLTVSAKDDLLKIKRVWEDRHDAIQILPREELDLGALRELPERCTPEEIAAAVGCSAHAVRAAMAEGRLSFELPPGRKRRGRTASRDDVIAWAKQRRHINRRFVELRGDLVGLPIESIERVEPTNEMVYDFSVADDENFICGTGGICCHNTDADVDGGHIVTLLLTFLYRYAPDLIKQGRVYIAELPLYRVEHKTKGRLYVYSDEELQKLVKEKQLKLRDGKPQIQRFKGLGEMQPEQLAECALNPETRRLRQVMISDEAEAEDITTLLMGQRVERRREYIEEHALEVEADV